MTARRLSSVIRPERCCILHGGPGGWPFDPIAKQLGDALWIDISETPRDYNYLLFVDQFDESNCGELFISLQSMRWAADKRLLAERFATHGVPTPQTFLVDSLDEAHHIRLTHPQIEWCLKYPTGCGASGHRMLTDGMTLPKSWPHPLIVQEFIRMPRPEVYRLYGAGHELFGWIARRFPDGAKTSEWVAHARGARYQRVGEPPIEAMNAARSALEAVELFDTFGCVDLLQRSSGEWVVLEVGTDGLFNHVDRELDVAELETELQRRIAEAFWTPIGWRPWGDGEWVPRTATF